jgi:phosphate transport system permease protein
LSFPHAERRLLWLLRGCASAAAAVVLLVLAFLVIEAWPALRDVGWMHWLGDPSWHPSEQRYNLLPMLAGTVYCSLGALLLALPFGIASALFSRYYAPAAAAFPYRRLLELLAGIPSVVYGLWGLTTLVPLIARLQPPGTSLLSAAVILALMVVPTIALTTDAALAAVPASYLHGAAALGLSRWSTIWRVALPAARSGVASGILLAAARAIGETMAVLMVCGNVVQFPRSLFDPLRTLTANIALEMAFAMGDHRAALFVSGLALMLLVAAMVGAAGLMPGGKAHGC